VQALTWIVEAQRARLQERGEYWTGDVRSLAGIPGDVGRADIAPIQGGEGASWRGVRFLAMEKDAEGRYYDLWSHENPQAFAVCAICDDGTTYIVDHRAEIWRRLSGGPVLRWPRAMADEGWTRVP
jgi:hypothetical protein